MRIFRIILCMVITLCGVTACSNQNDEVLADTFFYGCAYLDINQNEVIDEDDLKIGGAVFEISLGFRGTTSEGGCATVVIPGGIGDSYWPVKARMQPPEDSSYKLIGPAEILLEYPETQANFLFAE